jgi:hypothetical protein
MAVSIDMHARELAPGGTNVVNWAYGEGRILTCYISDTKRYANCEFLDPILQLQGTRLRYYMIHHPLVFKLLATRTQPVMAAVRTIP